MIRRGDKILIGFIAAVIIIGYGFKVYNNQRNKNTQKVASIEVDNKVVRTINLSKDKNEIFKLQLKDGELSEVEVNSGKIRIREANCPDKVCVRTGYISSPGDMIVCIPYHVVIKISGERQDVDVKMN